MPYANPAAQRAYQREWMRRRRDEWIAIHGPCAQCGSSESPEIDHIDPATKAIEPRGIWSLTAAKREAELAKCQVLCHDCHLAKTVRQLSSKARCGTKNAYSRGCRCADCTDAATSYARRHRAHKRAAELLNAAV